MLEEVAAWQARPLEAVYPLIFFDALRVKICDEGLVRNKAVHIALGVRADRTEEILGLWLEQNEGAKFWLRVMNELKNRGVEDVLIAVVDGLKGFPEAITAVFPHAMGQTYIVHLLRHSLDFVSWKDRKPVAAALKDIYRAIDAAAGDAALTVFEEIYWGKKYPAIGQSWRRAWGEVVPFYAFPGDVRRILYTTNSIEALNSKLRRAVRARGHFPSDEPHRSCPPQGAGQAPVTLQRAGLAAQILDLGRGHCACGVAGQALLASLQKFLRPAVITVLDDAFAAAQPAMLSSPRRPLSTMRIFLLRRKLPPGSAPDPLEDLFRRFLQRPGFLPHLRSFNGYDGPEILPIATQPICLKGADAGQPNWDS